MSCVCGMAFLCGIILVKVPLLQAGTVAILKQTNKANLICSHVIILVLQFDAKWQTLMLAHLVWRPLVIQNFGFYIAFIILVNTTVDTPKLGLVCFSAVSVKTQLQTHQTWLWCRLIQINSNPHMYVGWGTRFQLSINVYFLRSGMSK